MEEKNSQLNIDSGDGSGDGTSRLNQSGVVATLALTIPDPIGQRVFTALTTGTVLPEAKVFKFSLKVEI